MKSFYNLSREGFETLVNQLDEPSAFQTEKHLFFHVLLQALDDDRDVDLNKPLQMKPNYKNKTLFAHAASGLNSHSFLQREDWRVKENKSQKPWPLLEKDWEGFEYKNYQEKHDAPDVVQLDVLVSKMLVRGGDPWKMVEKNERATAGIDYILGADMGQVLDLHLRLNPEKKKELNEKLWGPLSVGLHDRKKIEEYKSWWHYITRNDFAQVAETLFKHGFDFSLCPEDMAHPLERAGSKIINVSLDYGVVPESERLIRKMESNLNERTSRGLLSREESLLTMQNLNTLKKEEFDSNDVEIQNYMSEFSRSKGLRGFAYKSYSLEDLLKPRAYKKGKKSLMCLYLEKARKEKFYQLPFSEMVKGFKRDGRLVDTLLGSKDVTLSRNFLLYFCSVVGANDKDFLYELGLTRTKAIDGLYRASVSEALFPDDSFVFSQFVMGIHKAKGSPWLSAEQGEETLKKYTAMFPKVISGVYVSINPREMDKGASDESKALNVLRTAVIAVLANDHTSEDCKTKLEDMLSETPFLKEHPEMIKRCYSKKFLNLSDYVVVAIDALLEGLSTENKHQFAELAQLWNEYPHSRTSVHIEESKKKIDGAVLELFLRNNVRTVEPLKIAANPFNRF